MKQSFLIKANANFTHLLQDLSLFAKDTAAKHGIHFPWLQFARRTFYGYRFLSNKKAHEHILSAIVAKTADKHPRYSTSYVSDVLSQLVNITVEDTIRLQGISISDRVLTPNEKQFLQTYLIAMSDSIHYVPRHPWFMPQENARGDTWQAKDIASEGLLTVSKKRKGDFYEYEIEHVNL